MSNSTVRKLQTSIRIFPEFLRQEYRCVFFCGSQTVLHRLSFNDSGEGTAPVMHGEGDADAFFVYCRENFLKEMNAEM